MLEETKSEITETNLLKSEITKTKITEKYQHIEHHAIRNQLIEYETTTKFCTQNATTDN